MKTTWGGKDLFHVFSYKPTIQGSQVRNSRQESQSKNHEVLMFTDPSCPGFVQFQTILFFSSIRLDYVFSIVSTSAFFDKALRRYVPMLGFFIFLIILWCDFCIMLDGYVTPSGLSFHSV